MSVVQTQEVLRIWKKQSCPSHRYSCGAQCGTCVDCHWSAEKSFESEPSFQLGSKSRFTQSARRAALLFKLLERDQAWACTANWIWVGICDMGTCTSCCARRSAGRTFNALTSLTWNFTAPALFWHSFIALSCHRQPWPAPGTRQDTPRSPGIQVKTQHNPTKIEDHKTIFTMARQLVMMLVTAGPVTCAISILAWYWREIYLATVQALWNKLQLLMSTPNC